MIGQPTVTRQRVASVVLGLLVGLVVVGVAVAGPAPPDVMTLNAPGAGTVITQNDPSLLPNCNAPTTFGNGYAINFSWNLPPDLTHVKRYELVLQHGTTGIPIVYDVAGATTTSYTDRACAFVIDTNLTGWHWHVSALNNGKKVIAVSAESSSFSFAECRLTNNSPCNAP